MPDLDDDFDNRAYHEPDYFTDPQTRREVDALVKPGDLFGDPEEDPDFDDFWETRSVN